MGRYDTIGWTAARYITWTGVREGDHKSIDSLGDECKRVFRKSRFEHKKNEEIATELGISVNTVKYHIKMALTRLHQDLRKYLILLISFFSLWEWKIDVSHYPWGEITVLYIKAGYLIYMEEKKSHTKNERSLPDHEEQELGSLLCCRWFLCL